MRGSDPGVGPVSDEIKHRARVVRTFPNDDAEIRLVGAVLADMHDESQVSDRRYLSQGSMALLKPTGDTGPSPPLASASQASRILESSPPKRLNSDPRVYARRWQNDLFMASGAPHLLGSMLWADLGKGRFP